MLAGICVEYYARLERGNLQGASDTVPDGFAYQPLAIPVMWAGSGLVG